MTKSFYGWMTILATLKKEIEGKKRKKTLTMDDFIHQQFGNKLLGQPSVKGWGLPTSPIKTNKNKIK